MSTPLALMCVVGLQLPTQGTTETGSWLRHIKPGAMVQFHVRGQGRLAGPIRRVGADSIVVGPALGYSQTDTAVALARVDSVWLLEPRSGRGLLVGGLVGGLFGYFIGSQQLKLCPPKGNETSGTCVGNKLGGAAIGGAIGAALGWAIGSAEFHWVQRLP